MSEGMSLLRNQNFTFIRSNLWQNVSIYRTLDKFERWNHILSVIIGHYLRFSKKNHFLGCFLLLGKEKILSFAHSLKITLYLQIGQLMSTSPNTIKGLNNFYPRKLKGLYKLNDPWPVTPLSWSLLPITQHLAFSCVDDVCEGEGW